MSKNRTTDIVIVGAGPIGLAVAVAAKQHNMSVKIIERGCLVNAIYNYPDDMTFFSSADKLEIGDVAFLSSDTKPTRREALSYYRRVAQEYELDLNLYESVKSIDGEKGDFTVVTDKREYKARYVVVATGFYGKPNLIDVPGEELDKVRHYYKDTHRYYKQKVLVVGAANSAVDAALSSWRNGAEVTMVVRGHEISEKVKYWVRPDIINRIKEGSITAYFETTIKEITPDSVILNTPEGEVTLENDFVLAMTGYKPNYAFMTACGIEISDTDKKLPVFCDDSLETNREGVYVAGVVCGGMDTNALFIENSRVHAEQIINHIASNG